LIAMVEGTASNVKLTYRSRVWKVVRFVCVV